MQDRTLNAVATVCAVIAVVPIVERTVRSYLAVEQRKAEERSERDRRWLAEQDGLFQRAVEDLQREVRTVLTGPSQGEGGGPTTSKEHGAVLEP